MLALPGAKAVNEGCSTFARSSTRICTGAPLMFALTVTVSSPVERTSNPSVALSGVERSM